MVVSVVDGFVVSVFCDLVVLSRHVLLFFFLYVLASRSTQFFVMAIFLLFTRVVVGVFCLWLLLCLCMYIPTPLMDGCWRVEGQEKTLGFGSPFVLCVMM